jgi:amino acid transporter
MSRDSFGPRGLGKPSRWGTPALATGFITVLTAVIYVVYLAGGATASDAFAWSGSIGTLILLVAYALATIGMVLLVFVRRRMPSVPMWQLIIPVAAIALLGYTLYRNVFPYPSSGPSHWFPIVTGGWLLAAIIAVLALPRTARRLGDALAAGLKGTGDTPRPN